MKLWVLVVCLLQALWCSRAYHVLVVFPTPSRSHNTLGKGIVDALLQAGHEVSWATPYPPEEKVKGLNIIDVSITVPIADSLQINIADVDRIGGNLSMLRDLIRKLSRTTLEAPGLREALIKGKYDAVVTEYFFSDTDAGFAAVLQVPWILMSSVQMTPLQEGQVDEVRSISTIPIIVNSSEMPMKFWNRLINSVIYFVLSVAMWFEKPSLVGLYEEIFSPLAAARGTTLPPFEDAYYNVSVLLLNTHASYSPAFSQPPNVINIGGYHLKEKIPPLPKDLQDLLDGSPQGVIYFSMGSVLKSATFPEVTKRDLLRLFGELPYTVLWKFEEQLEGRPKNVHIRPWMPQDSILAHPNIKVFITHGGMLSTLEALNNGVPLLALPMYGDQASNAERAFHAGYAKHIKFRPDMAQEVKEALHELLSNNTYHERAQYLSKLFRNRPVSPKKLISHYIEVAIESKGAYHLRSSSQLYAWYQRWMLDQLALLLGVLIVLFVVIRCALRACFNRIWGAKTGISNKVKKH